MESAPEIRVIIRPEDTNHGGTVFGGFIMAQADLAGSVLAIRSVGGGVVTRAIESFEFIRPAKSGDMLNFHTKVIRTGVTSITVGVTITSEDVLSGVVLIIATAVLVFVHINDDGLAEVI